MSELKPYPAYKDSGIEWLGEVPEGWEVRPVRSVVDDRNERNKLGDEAFYLSLVAGRGVMPYAEKGDIGNKKPEDLDRCKVVVKDDLVINSMNYGIGAYGISKYDGVCSPVYIVLQAKASTYVPFVKRVFEARTFQRLAQSFGNGILEHRRAISWEILKTLRVGLPPLPEQQLIADFLDRETAAIDAFVQTSEQLIELLNERRGAVITRAVTKGLDANVPMKDSGIEWLGEVPEVWGIERARFLCRIGTGYGDTIDSVDDGTYPFYVRSDIPERSNSYDFDGEAVLTSGDGAGVGKVFHLVSGKFAAHQRVYVLNTFAPRMMPAFFYYVFSSFFALVALDGSAKSTVDSVRRHMLTNFPVTVPPLSEQQAIVAHIERETAQIDEAITEARNAIELAKERRQALISAAVTGKIDVREAV